MFRFHEEADGRTKQENLEIAKQILEDLMGVVPTLISMKVNLNSPFASKDNYDLVLDSEFESMEGLQEYVVHPAHKKVGEFMQKVRESRASIDFEA
jgi:hypothetical protein